MLFFWGGFVPHHQSIMKMHEILGVAKKSRASFVKKVTIVVCLFQPSAALSPVFHHLVSPFADGRRSLTFILF